MTSKLSFNKMIENENLKWKVKKKIKKLNIKTKMKTNQKQKVENENIKTKGPHPKFKVDRPDKRILCFKNFQKKI